MQTAWVRLQTNNSARRIFSDELLSNHNTSEGRAKPREELARNNPGYKHSNGKVGEGPMPRALKRWDMADYHRPFFMQERDGGKKDADHRSV